MLPPATRSTNLSRISLSSSEHCGVKHFIQQYIQTRDVKPADRPERRLISALLDYPCAVRVSLYELNAWLDSRLGLRALHP